MKKLLFILLLAGCCTLQKDYVEQDRRNYETLAPRVRKMLETTTEYDADQKQDIEDRLQGWDTKSAAAMEAVSDER
jgi:hypothetical protein